MAKGRNINGERKNSAIIIFIFITIIIIAFIGIGYQFIVTGSKTGYVALKPIDVTVSSDGKEHKLSMKVTLGGKSKDLNKLNTENVQLVVKETVRNLDYNSITEENGEQYIKEAILTNLKKSFGEDVESVTLDSLLTDVTVVNPDDKKPNSNPSRQEILDNIGWSKNK